jgi:diguanylate cyclase (GGDEF)-like protein
MLKIFSLFLFATLMLHAEVLQISSKMEGLSTLPYISYFEDKTKKMDLKEIKNLAFESKDSFHFNQGISNSNWWLKLHVKNPTNKPIDWILKFNYGQIDELQSWQYDDKGVLLSHFLKGDHFIDTSVLSFKERTAFEFNTRQKTENTIYIKLAYVNYGIMETFHTLYTKEEFEKSEQFRFYMIVGLSSALCILLFYNIFIWLILRKKEYFWYNAYLLGVIFSMLMFNQVGAHFLWNTSIYLIDMMPFLSVITLLVSFILFTRAFLETDKLLPRADKILKILILFNALALVLAFLGQRHLAIGIVQISLLSFIFFPVLGFKLWRAGYKIARGYTIASLVVSITVMISILRFSEVLQTSELLYWMSRFGFIVEGVLLSIALADRITILEHDYLIEQNKAKQTLEEAKKTLESEVKKRTHELEIQTQKAETIARMDEMTGIYNRRAFIEHGEKLIYDAIRYKTDFSLIILDLDFFKNINDTYGHEAGDTVLISFSKEVSNHLRDTDFFARIGGEEFVILLSHTKSSQAFEKASTLLKMINELEIFYNDSILKVTASIGICDCVDSDETIYSLLAKADQALYYVKEHGRNSVHVYERSTSPHVITNA